jgi:hypothetical protein
MPKTIFVGGHGRTNENVSFTCDGSVAVQWFGNLGNPVTKGYTKAILGGVYGKVLALSTDKSIVCEHFTCASVAVEYAERSAAFHAGAWDTDAYFVQGKQGFAVPLSKLIAIASSKWPNEPLVFKWAVCRSSIISGKTGAHDYNLATGLPGMTGDGSDQPTKPPAGEVIGDGEGALYWEQWGVPLPVASFGSSDSGQEKNVQGFQDLILHGSRCRCKEEGKFVREGGT